LGRLRMVVSRIVLGSYVGILESRTLVAPFWNPFQLMAVVVLL
jgi:hypothetical protein